MKVSIVIPCYNEKDTIEKIVEAFDVPQFDLLAFRISPAAVRNPYLINPAAAAGEFGNNVRLNTETIFFEMDRFDNRGFERSSVGAMD
jgi:hypothetical protein